MSCVEGQRLVQATTASAFLDMRGAGSVTFLCDISLFHALDDDMQVKFYEDKAHQPQEREREKEAARHSKPRINMSGSYIQYSSRANHPPRPASYRSPVITTPSLLSFTTTTTTARTAVSTCVSLLILHIKQSFLVCFTISKKDDLPLLSYETSLQRGINTMQKKMWGSRYPLKAAKATVTYFTALLQQPNKLFTTTKCTRKACKTSSTLSVTFGHGQ